MGTDEAGRAIIGTCSHCGASLRLHAPAFPVAPPRQAGAIAILFALLLIPLIAICGFAIDLAMLYNRKAEMRNVAHAVALAAAKKLNGTAAGVSDAVSAAASVAALQKFNYYKETVTWSSAALTFSSKPDRHGSWTDATGAAADAARVYYVKVDTEKLDPAGTIQTALMRVISSSFNSMQANSEIIAGRTSIDIAPLAICAMSAAPATRRNNSASNAELVEYGFRRGVSYNLMDLNPAGTDALNFLLNPLAAPGTSGQPSDFAPSTVGPYACTGSLGIPRVTGDPISVSPAFPLGALYKQLNARFDQYDNGQCTAHGALPDANIKSYSYTDMALPTGWVTIAPLTQAAAAVVSDGKRQTIADLPPATGTANQYGTLWAYAKAVPYAAYSAGVAEPSAGYPTFTTASWAVMYGGQTVKAYPPGSATPYKSGASSNSAKPAANHAPGLRNRRVLNVALLSCAATPSTTANVLAVAKFFMTVPATSTALAAEFAGTIPLERISGNVQVFP